MGDFKEWSQIGQQLSANGTPLFCPKCKFKLQGERYCPNCNLKIIYSGENPDGSVNSFESAGDKMINFGDKLGKAGKSMSNFGSSMIWGCTIPIIIIVLLFLFL